MCRPIKMNTGPMCRPIKVIVREDKRFQYSLSAEAADKAFVTLQTWRRALVFCLRLFLSLTHKHTSHHDSLNS